MKRLLLVGLGLLLTGLGQMAKADDLVAAVLPSSRSGLINKPVTVFATIINTSGSNATGCAITTTQSGVTLTYQTTDPLTNKLVGSPNTPVSIAANGSQSFLLALTSSVVLQAVDVPITFDCTGLQPAAIISGLDTLLLSAAATAPSDIVALATTVQGNGVVATGSEAGASAFAVASVDVGAGTAITVTPDLGDLNFLPVTLAICQTDANGNCTVAPSAAVTNTYTTGSTATYGIFVTATGPVPFAPASARVYVTFTDSSGVVRGKTSVALSATPNSSHPGSTPGGIYVGLWRVTSSAVSPQPISVMVSEDGEFHLLPGFTKGATPAPIMRETLALAFQQNLTLTATGTAYAAGAGPSSATGTVSASGIFIPHRAIVMSYTNGTEQGLFHLNYVPRFYEQPSTLALIAGTRNLRDESLPKAAQGSITINTNGSFSGTGTTGCAETGMISVINAKYSVYRIAVNQPACGGAAAITYNGLSTIQSVASANDTLVTEASSSTTAFMNYITSY